MHGIVLALSVKDDGILPGGRQKPRKIYVEVSALPHRGGLMEVYEQVYGELVDGCLSAAEFLNNLEAPDDLLTAGEPI